MQFPSKRFAILFVAVIGVALLPWMSPQAASSKVPPTIDQMVGRWEAKDKHTTYDLTTGAKQTGTYVSYCQFTKVDDTTLNLYFESDDPEPTNILVHYQSGILFGAAGNSETLATKAQEFVLVVSGTAPKLKAKGDVMSGNLPENQVETMKITFKRISDLPD